MTTVRITWIDSVTPGVTGHKVYRDDIEIADVGLLVQTYDDATAAADTTYKYEVQAYTAIGESIIETLGVNTQNITTIVEPVVDVKNYIFDRSIDCFFNTDLDLNGYSDSTFIIVGTVDSGSLVEARMFGCHDSHAKLISVYREDQPSNPMQLKLSDGSDSSSVLTTTWTTDDLEHTFAFRYDKLSGREIFVDGVSVGSDSEVIFQGWINSSLFQIGTKNTAPTETNGFLGKMNRIQYYNRALTDPEITTLQSDMDGVASNKIADFKDDKTTGVWTDDVGGFVATNVGGVTLEI